MPNFAADLGTPGPLDPRKFYTRCEDTKGHSFDLRAKVPKSFAGAIQALVEQIPAYKNSSDFVRDAVNHRLSVLAQEGFVSPTEVAPFLISAEAERHSHRATSMMHLPNQIRTTAKKLRQTGDAESLEEFLGNSLDSASTFPASMKARIEKLITRIRANPSSLDDDDD